MTTTEMPATTPATLTPQQAVIAHALAGAHAHHWATALTALEVIGLTSAQISDKACAVLEPGIGCWNDCPGIDADGYVQHVTGTGRLTWSIAPNGHTIIKVCRPHPDGRKQEPVEVVYLNLPPFRYEEDTEGHKRVTDWCLVQSGYHDDGEPLTYPANEVLPLERHLDTAKDAVRALQHICPSAADALRFLESEEVATIIAANEEKERERLKAEMRSKVSEIAASEDDLYLLLEVGLARLQGWKAAGGRGNPKAGPYDAIRQLLTEIRAR